MKEWSPSLPAKLSKEVLFSKSSGFLLSQETMPNIRKEDELSKYIFFKKKRDQTPKKEPYTLSNLIFVLYSVCLSDGHGKADVTFEAQAADFVRNGKLELCWKDLHRLEKLKTCLVNNLFTPHFPLLG